MKEQERRENTFQEAKEGLQMYLRRDLLCVKNEKMWDNIDMLNQRRKKIQLLQREKWANRDRVKEISFLDKLWKCI